MSDSSDSAEPRVGITLITGFLGAGKSTLIRRILTENHRKRIVVVENEFSENSSVEQAIVTQGIGPDALEDFIELPNGCICCAAQDDLTDALQRLVHSKRGLFDHILVEASGLADPAPVAASLWVDDGADSPLYLDSIVTIVDAVNVQKWLSDTDHTDLADLAKKQLAIADLVLLNKTDLLQKSSRNTISCPSATQQQPSSGVDACENLSQVKSLIRDHGCTAEIIPTTKCDVEISRLLNIRAYEERATIESVSTSAIAREGPPHHGHTHVESAASVTIVFTGDSFESSKLDRAFGEILWENCLRADDTPFEVWRMKGLAVIKGEEFKEVYQSVHTLYDHSPSNIPWVKDMTSCFIFIGNGLDSTKLKEHLSRALAT